jgi:hypothetical protein
VQVTCERGGMQYAEHGVMATSRLDCCKVTATERGRPSGRGLCS